MVFLFGWFWNLNFGRLFLSPLEKGSLLKIFHVMQKVGVNIILLMMLVKGLAIFTILNINSIKDS